ncbi:LamG-like jellyroll fold domain-containing protein [Polaribacter sp. IC073]|uniref:LamG-like jellyroll fold domain-containing protein n=1 Tax=Polaribacter sp. IC073 TaxID=2508540 RepID=UPI0011BD73C1|nr:LamG-like jellyroll fold domain-containing protein [Polaribacter sp. IC073]TXD46351.1 T9SS type A sorting domain-containing protein [Polaribacter sp. IC073]
MKLKLFFFTLVFCSFIQRAQVSNQSINYNTDQTGLVSFGDIDQVDGVSQFTFEAWVKVDAWQENSTIFIKRTDNSNKIGIQLGNQSNGQLFFMVSSGGNAYQSANTSLKDGKWHHVALVYDGYESLPNDRVTAYVDGVSVSNFHTGTIPTTSPNTSANFELGNNFTGNIDEVRIWNVALTQAQLDYKNTINKIHPLYDNLLNYWKIDKTAINTIYDVKGTINGLITGNAVKQVVTDNPIFKYRIVSAYVRPNFYQLGSVKGEYLRNNNDIVFLTAAPYANGELFFENPINDATFTNATHLVSFSGRNGVADINAAGSLNSGKHLMRLATGGIPKFTFSAWVYIDTWVEGSTIVSVKLDDNNKIGIELGNSGTNELLFQVANGTNTYVSANTSITTGVWNHIALVFDGTQVTPTNRIKGYINASQVVTSNMGVFPTLSPNINENMILGTAFDGKLDEVNVTNLALSSGNINSIKNKGIVIDSWNETFTRAYLKFDDASSPGKDSQTWKIYYDQIVNAFDGYDGVEYRIGFIGGDWEAMIGNSAARTNFANNINNLLSQYPTINGIDLDFEWCTNNTCWNNYNSAITTINNVIPSMVTFSATLHPLYYNINISAVSALDFISSQSYGPSAQRFPRAEFINNVTTFLNHGVPKEKLVMGLPFYGVRTVASGGALAYANFIATYPNLDPSLDVVDINGVSMTFNGQETIAYKSNHVVEQDLAGVMAWDSATDIDYDQTLNLLRAVNSKMNANVEIPISIDDSLLLKSLSYDKPSKVKYLELVSWPNPSNNTFSIKLRNAKNTDKVNIEVFDTLGKLVHKAKFNWNEDYKFGKRLERGGYIVTVSQYRSSQNIRIVKY